MDTTPKEGENSQPDRGLRNGTVSFASSRSRGERALPYLLALMETCWVDTILIAIAGTTLSHTFWLPLWVPFVVLAGSCWSANSFSHSQESTSGGSTRSTLSFIGTLLVVLLIAGAALFSLWNGLYASSIAFYDPTWLANLLSAVFLLGPEAFRIVVTIALILYFHWRGLRLAHTVLEPGNMFFGIRLGIGVLLAVIVYRAATDTTSFDEVLLLFLIPLFLVAALVAHALAQTSFMRTLHRSGLQGNASLQERALIVVSVAFGAVLFLASLAVGAFASPAFFTDMQYVLSPVAIVYDWLTRAIAFVMTLLVAPFIWLLQVFHFKLHEPNYQVQTSQITCKKYPHALQCLKKVPSPQNASDTLLLTIAKIVLPIVIVVLIVLIVMLFTRMRRIRVARRLDEVHESLWSWELFLTQVRAFFRVLWLRLFPLRAAVSVQGNIDEGAVEPAARSIREVYRAMLRWAADRGYPRKKDETPYEFRLRLRARLPLTEPELGTMTDAYTAIRYGRAVPSDAEVAYVQQIWSQLCQKPLDREDHV